MRIQAGTLHLFRSVVIRLKPHGRKGQFLCRVNIGMRHVDTPVENRGLTEHDVFFVGFVLSGDILQPLKPHQVHHSRAIGKMSYQPALTTFSEHFKTQNPSAQLDVRHVAVYLMDVIQTTAVHILVWEIIQQVA